MGKHSSPKPGAEPSAPTRDQRAPLKGPRLSQEQHSLAGQGCPRLPLTHWAPPSRHPRFSSNDPPATLYPFPSTLMCPFGASPLNAESPPGPRPRTEQGTQQKVLSFRISTSQEPRGGSLQRRLIDCFSLSRWPPSITPCSTAQVLSCR